MSPSILLDGLPEEQELEVHFWETPHKIGEWYDLMAAKSAQRPLADFFRSLHLPYTSISDDVQRSLREKVEKEALLSSWGRRLKDHDDASSPAFIDLTRYQSLDDVGPRLRSLREKVEKEALLSSWGRRLKDHDDASSPAFIDLTRYQSLDDVGPRLRSLREKVEKEVLLSSWGRRLKDRDDASSPAFIDLTRYQSLDDVGPRLRSLKEKVEKEALLSSWGRRLKDHDDASSPAFIDLTRYQSLDDVGPRLRSLREKVEKEALLSSWGRRLKDHDDASSPAFIDLTRYQSLDDIEEYMDRLARYYPDLARVRTLGITHEGIPIKALEVTGNVRNRAEEKPEIFIEGGMHAREWVAPHVALYIMAKLIGEYEGDEEVRELVRGLRWIIVPTSNPDGYFHTWQARTHPRAAFWRKNRAPVTCHRRLKSRCCRGVDLNRNFDFEWAGSDTSEDPCSDVYPGARPFSEPETRAIRDYIWPRKERIQAFISLHSYSQILAYSSAAYRGYYPTDVKDLDKVGWAAQTALRKRYGTEYDVGSSADELYPASGTALDWAKERAGIKYSYLLELRPDKDFWNSLDAFFPDPDTLLPTGRETWEAVRVIAKAAAS